MIISLHFPKTAGSSFRKSLENQFGKHLLKDYGDLPINTPVSKRNMAALYHCILNGFRNFQGINCIHGHFLPLKYLLVGFKNKIRFITWMRDPVERLASHYHFWKRSYDPDNSPALHKRVIEEKWSFEQFCFSNELRNFYSQFLWGFPFDRFEFVGLTEHYETELKVFFDVFFGDSPTIYHENINPENDKKIYVEGYKLRHEIEKFHEKDMILYRKVKQKQLSRQQT